MRKVFMLQKLIGNRYENLDLLKSDIESLSKSKVTSMGESEHEEYTWIDNIIDVELDDCDLVEVFYLKDNGGKYYITEISWLINVKLHN